MDTTLRIHYKSIIWISSLVILPNILKDNMKRFHKTICFPSQYNTQLKELTNAFNTKEKYGYTNHAYENLKTRFNLMDIRPKFTPLTCQNIDLTILYRLV
jgi:hypothetical protein